MAGYYISLRPKGLEQLGDDLHITLAYLGKPDHVDVKWTKATLTEFASDWDGLRANIYGVATWIAGRSYFTVGLVDGWEVRQLHEQVIDILEGQGTKYSDRYPFNPHVTLDERKVPGPSPVITKLWPFTADTLYLSKGDVHVPLGGGG